MSPKYEESDGRKRNKSGDRNFDKEARALLSGLSEMQLYKLFEIVHTEMKRPCTDERTLELQAVKKAIRSTPGVQPYRFDRIINGYQSEMARTGRPKDGQFIPYKKKT
tara:strand:- start:3742 stop:4065 length:324 start_codon:yes stop_codon:yes gene_type:complete